ncbi:MULTISPECIES: FAD-binding oxidoreductase [unclassified Bosea (in: a-proteobacteria)]|uniref:NAD(P)/FAD-dependent oxidoreductase n=1 Tax=unclassified Bosea (in: a-proteobacteria) TaxID=2653178 RepID=UPI000F7572B3|nr:MULTISPECIES: FAD-binding oxidoreductase [unclassified Bosea (in: a-proteobacteria)]AZO80589.1 FAD-dependent oxidoreductase [Bosea sp. Tri-49]RXT23394.1 FAD-dependent oxidoreductase [Bosea sp. Tri-39]RXT38867.1 FAD-dependent oxidoreductase [Bosea sp. Tri-54]
MQRCDVVIVGGGAIGASIAYFLRSRPNSPSVAVIEPDPTYAKASTPRASGGVRRLFSGRENIALSNFSIPFFERFAEGMAVDGEHAEIGYHRGGYLFIVGESGAGLLERNAEIQSRLGVRLDILRPTEIKDRFPSMHVDDLALAAHSVEDGWLDPNSVLQGFRRKARELGASFIADRVVSLHADNGRVRSVELESGARIAADWVVNAAGAWAGEVCRMIGMAAPIAPMRRFEHYFESEHAFEPLPYVKDLNRLAFRPEGKGFTGGVPDGNEPRGFNFETDHGYFERVVWPALAHRFPGFERTREKNVMPGLYDQNEFDGNGIVGPWTGGCENFILAAGFSGHGLMHAPGVGRAVAELIVDGAFQTIDLTPLGWARVANNEPYRELGIL